MFPLQASEESLAALAERYAVAATSITKDGACLDLERIEAEALGLIAASGSAESSEEKEEQEEGSSEEDSSDEDSSDEDSSDEESSEEEDGSSGEEGCDVQTGAAGVEKAGEGVASTLPSVAAAAAAAAPDFLAPAPIADEGVDDAETGTRCDPKNLPGSKGRVTSSQDEGGGVGKLPASGASTSVCDVAQSTSSRGVARSADLLQLETLVGGAGSTCTGDEASATLASRLAVLSLGEQRASLGPEGVVEGLREADGANGPVAAAAVSSKKEGNTCDAGSVVDGTDRSQRTPLIEEL